MANRLMNLLAHKEEVKSLIVAQGLGLAQIACSLIDILDIAVKSDAAKNIVFSVKAINECDEKIEAILRGGEGKE
jgi:hypothetical protein